MINAAKQCMLAGSRPWDRPGHGSPIAAGIVARSGFDFVLVDYQHGDWDDASAWLPFAPSRWDRPCPWHGCVRTTFTPSAGHWIGGALGIVVPMVTSPDEARRGLRHALPPPG
jgi:2-keto-3-deoxy-L-rhamnonate aldolase RhmA